MSTKRFAVDARIHIDHETDRRLRVCAAREGVNGQTVVRRLVGRALSRPERRVRLEEALAALGAAHGVLVQMLGDVCGGDRLATVVAEAAERARVKALEAFEYRK